MTYKEIIKALECCNGTMSCSICPFSIDRNDCAKLEEHALDLIKRQKAEIERLELVLLGVMHSVDKWLDGKELEQDEVNRAATMREKTLQITEKQQAEIERLKDEIKKLKYEMSYMLNPNTIGDRHEMGG